jgi:histidinol-phosphate aminotransferase
VNAFKPHLAKVADYPYVKVGARTKLDQNESPEDFPAPLKARALERLAALQWNRYPDLGGEEVRAALARHEGWPEKGIVLSAGSNLLILALCSAANRVLDTAPAFPYYKGAAFAAGTPWEAVPLLDGFALPLEGLLARMEPSKPGLLFLPNPHGPTGKLFEPTGIERLAECARETGWVLVIDEAYQAFSGTDYGSLARANPSVALLRTFSKSWSLGGIRAGYLLGSPRVAAVAAALLPPFRIPAHTAAILLTAIESPGYIAPMVARIRAERDRLFTGLSNHPRWKPYPSAANYILVRTADAKGAYDHLLARGILIRRQDHYLGLEGCIRVTIGSPAENDAFLSAAQDAP